MNPLDVLRQIIVVVIAAITAAELEAEGPGGGALKKAQVLAYVQDKLGPLLPRWVAPMLPLVVEPLIDGFVKFWNRQGWTAGDISEADRESAPIPPVAERPEPC